MPHDYDVAALYEDGIVAHDSYLEQLPAIVRDHLFYRMTESAGPLRQQHVIEGLLGAAYE